MDLVADFETTTDPEDCRVWAWGLANVSDVPWFKHGNSLPSFINMLASFDSYVYFHNLAFDMYFILDWLFNNGFEHTTGKARRGTFSTLIDRMGKAYTIDVMWNNGRKTQFRDSLKRIPMPVRDIAATFDLPIMKGEIDYHAYREPGHNLTGEEVAYLKNDVHIVAMALDIQKREGMTKLTVGSDALHSYKTLGQGDWFRQRFPLLDRDWDADIRKAYRGGFTYADPRLQGKILGEGNVYDVNSLYPSVMQQKPIPWGVPQRFNTLAEAEDNMRPGDFCVTNIAFGATLKPDHIPCIQVKGSSMYQATEYQSVIEPGTDMWVCNVDLQLWREQYDVGIEVAGVTYVFRTETGLFNDYIERWGAIKRNSFGGRRAIAKLFLREEFNSLYGKFATNPDCTGKIPVLVKGVVRLVAGEPEERDPVYTAAGVAITAHARAITVRAAQAHYQQFAYADTDSLHLVGEPPQGLDIDPSRLGAWKHEGHFTRALFARAKAYTEEQDDGRLVTHIAGLPATAAELVRFEDYFTGKVFTGKLTPVKVPGGVVLKDVGFTLAKLLDND